MAEETKIYQVNGKYRVAFKRSDTKGIDGFTVEVNSDDLTEAQEQAKILYDYAKKETEVTSNDNSS